MDPNLINPLMIEFKETPQIFLQLQTMFTSINKLSSSSWDSDNFHKWTPIIMFIWIYMDE